MVPKVRFLSFLAHMGPFPVIFWVLEVSHFCTNIPLGVVNNAKKENLYMKNEHVHVNFVNLIFRNFA